MSEFQFWSYYLSGVVFIISFFLLFRAVVLWYWKINKAIDILEKIEENTRKNSEK